MEQYYDRKNTPLKYHTAMRYVLLPLGMLAIVATYIQDVLPYLPYLFKIPEQFLPDGYWPIMAVLVFTDFCRFLLMLITFIGFLKWRSYSWYTILILYPVTLLSSIFSTTVNHLWNEDLSRLSTSSLPAIIFTALLAGGLIFYCLLIYYRKRKPLFFPQLAEELRARDAAARAAAYSYTNQPGWGAPVPPSGIPGESPRGTSWGAQQGTPWAPHFCPRCGTPLEQGFCPRCRQQITPPGQGPQ